MADETTKVVILSVELDLNQFSQAVSQAEKDLEGLLTQQAVLIAQNKQGTQEYALLSAQIQKTRKDYKDNAAALNTVQQLQKKNTGSIIEMRRELSAATLQYNNLSKAERDNTAVGGRLQAQIKSLSNELKKNEGAVGDNRRNVGNYQQAIQGALSQTNLFGGSLSQLSGILSSGGVLGIALAGSIGLLKGLEAAFAATERGAELLERRSSGAGASIDVAVGNLAKVGESLENNPFFPTLSKIKGSLSVLAAFLTGGKESLIQAKEAAQITEQLTGRTQDLEDAERGLNLQISENNVLIDKNLARAKNKGLSDQERIDLLTIAGEKEKENLELQQRALDERISIQQSINELERRAKGQTGDENLKILSDLQVEKNKLDQESLALLERIGARQSSIYESAAKEKEASDAKQIASEKRKQAELQKIGKIIFVDDYKALLEQRKETTDLFGAQEELELKQQFANRLITEEQFAQGLISVEVSRLQAELDLLIENSSTELTLENEIAAKKIEIATAIADGKIKENERVTANTKKETDKQIKIAQEQAAITEDFIVGIGQAFSDSLTDQGLQVESFAKNVLLVVLDTLEKTITASIATATATSLAQPDSVATFGVTGIARAAVLTGLIKAAFAVVKGQIGKDSGAKFAHGGLQGHGDTHIIGGQPHSRGGTKFIGSDGTRFEAEKGELITVINKRSTDMLRYWSNINQIGGGVDFFKTSPSNYMADGGFAARSISSPIQNQFSQSQDLPPIIVLVEDINSAQGIKARVESRARF